MPESPPNRLREIRRARRLSQHALGAMIGTGNQMISKLETGKIRMNVEWMDKLSKALGCAPYELLNNPVDAHAAEERAALDRFRRLPPERRERVIELLKWLGGDE